MRSSARIDASSSLHSTCDSGLGRTRSGTSEQACQLAELAQPPSAQQAELQQSHRCSQGDIEQPVQDAASVPCLQLHGWDSQPHQQHQQHGQLLSQPYPHLPQQQLMSLSAGMGVSTAGHPLQLLQALSAAAELPDPSISPALMPRQELVQLSQQKEELQLRSGHNMSAAEVSFEQHQHQQCEPWRHESAAQHNPFLHAMQQQQQGTPSAATTASNVSAFASAAGEGGSIGNRSSSAGGSSGGSSSGGGAGLATVIGRTVTGELPVIPQGYGSLQAAAAAAAAGNGLAQQQPLSTHHSVHMPAEGSAVAAGAASHPGPASGAAAGAEQHHPQQQQQQQQQQQPQQQQQQQQQEQFILRHTRQITCKTYLKRLNVTQYMSDNLLPTMEGSLRVSSQKAQPAMAHLHGSKGHANRHNAIHRSRSAAAASDDEYDPHGRSTAAAAAAAGDHKHTSGSGGGSSQRSYEMMFKVQIKLVDSAGQVWPVTYEGVMCAGQRHLRLTCGWSEFIKAKKIGIGDAITFEQRGGNKTVLAVAIQKAGQQAEEMWVGPLPQDAQIKVLIGSLRSDSAAASARGQDSAAAAKGSAGCGSSSHVVAASPSAVAPAVGGRGRQPGQHQQVVPGVGGAGRHQQVKRGGVHAKRTKKRRQRDDSDADDDGNDRDFSRSYDEASSGSTAVTDGTAGTNSGGRLNSTATAATFAPAVQGLQALRVGSAPGRLGRSESLAAATAAAIAAVDACIVDGPAEGSDGSVPRSGSEGLWQQQQPGVLLHKQLSPAMAPAGVLGQSRYALESPGYAPQAAQLQLQQQQHFQRRLRQRQLHDDQCLQLKLESLGPGASDQAAGQAAGANKYTEMAAAAVSGNRRLAEWAAVNRLTATDSVQSRQLLQQQSQQQVQEEQHRQQRQYQQQLYSSGSAPLSPGPAYSQPMGLAQGMSPNPGSSRYVGWQVSTGFVGGPSLLPGNGRSGDVYTGQQELYADLQPMPSIAPAAGGSAVEGTAPVPVPSQQQSLLSQQRPKLNQQQSVGGGGSLAPQDLAAYGSGVYNSGVYQPASGTHYPPHRKGPSPSDLAPGQTPAAHRSSIMDAASTVARTLMMGPSRTQQQQAGVHLYSSAAQLPRAYSLQQQQQVSQPMVVDSRGSWPVSGSAWQQQQQLRPSYLVKTEQLLHPDSAWDPQMLHASLPAAAKQQSASPYKQVQLPQLPQQVPLQDHKQQQHQPLEGVSAYEQTQQQGDASPYEQVQQQQRWQEALGDDPTTSAGVVAHAVPQHQLQHEQSQGQLLESAGMSAEYGSLDSIGAMESVELVDTLLQLLGGEQADHQQQQHAVAAGASMAPLQQQRHLQEAMVATPEAGPQINHVLQPQSLYQQTMQPHLQAPQLDHPPGTSSLLQQWLQQPSHKSQLAPPTLLPLEAVIHPQLQPGAG